MASQSSDSVLSHWSTLIENFQTSPLAFYQAVEAALRSRELPQTQNSRVDYREAGLASANREYLHVARERLLFDICGAPFGTGFFVSWWLTEDRLRLNPLVRMLAVFVMLAFGSWLVVEFGPIVGIISFVAIVFSGLTAANAFAMKGVFNDSIVLALPMLGTLYGWLFKPSTYFRLDTMEMFQRAVHNAVLETIDAMTAEKGLRALSESERKPIMREFYARAR